MNAYDGRADDAPEPILSAHQTEQLLQWAGACGRPSMVVDADRRLLWANNAALDALSERRDVLLREGRVTLTGPGATEDFAAFLGGVQGAGAWCVSRADGDGSLVFRAYAIAGLGAFGVRFHGTGSDFRLAWADFSGVFGLTPAEHRVVQLLLNGFSAVEAARELGASVETVRTHVRRTYAKLDVGTREALFLRLAPFRLL